MRIPKGRRLFALAIALDLSLLGLVWFALRYPAAFEEIYTRGFFAWYAETAGWLSDRIPFSVHEAIGLVLFLLVLRATARFVLRLCGRRQARRKSIGATLQSIFVTLSLAACAFYLLWGLNYFRPRLVHSSCFDKGLVTVERSTALAQNCLSALIALAGTACPPDRILAEEMQTCVHNAMRLIGDRPLATAVRVKYFLGGWLSALPSTGVTLPLLPENHVSLDLFDYEKPFIIAHEKAHLQGRAMESEANYLALLACLSSEHPSIRKSGVFFLFRMLLRTLPPGERAHLISLLPDEYRQDLRAPAIRLAQKSAFVVALFQALYGNFLKAQRIEDGLANYSAALTLVLGFRLNSGQTLAIDGRGRLVRETE